MLETSDPRTVLHMMLDIVTIRVIPSLRDSLISSHPHITTLLTDTFVCFLFCWVLYSDVVWTLTQHYNQLYRWMLSRPSSWSFRMLYTLRTRWILQLTVRQLQLPFLLWPPKYMPVVLASHKQSFLLYCDEILKVYTCSCLFSWIASWPFRAVISPTLCKMLSWMYYESLIQMLMGV